MKKRVKNLDDIYLGEEPKFIGEISLKNDSNLAKCLNWYSNLDNKKIYPWLTKYLAKDLTKKEINRLINSGHISVRYLSIFLRMKDNGTIFSGELSNIIDSQLAIASFNSKSEDIVIDNMPKNVISIQDKIIEKSRKYCSEIDEVFDDFFFKNNCKGKFNTYNWLKTNDVSSQSTQYIHDTYFNILTEFKSVSDKTDTDLVEAYSHIPKKNINSAILFIESILNDCNTWKNNKKQIRKPRKKKQISVEKQINSLKYMKEYSKFKIVSIAPDQIIGSRQLWVFNTKYNQLTCYNSNSEFSIKGTTLQNIDIENSIRKTCRKPEDILSKVLNGGKIQLRKIMSELTTKPIELNGRINEHCILLRTIK